MGGPFCSKRLQKKRLFVVVPLLPLKCFIQLGAAIQYSGRHNMKSGGQLLILFKYLEVPVPETCLILKWNISTPFETYSGVIFWHTNPRHCSWQFGTSRSSNDDVEHKWAQSDKLPFHHLLCQPHLDSCNLGWEIFKGSNIFVEATQPDVLNHQLQEKRRRLAHLTDPNKMERRWSLSSF